MYTIGILAAEQVALGLIESHQLIGELHTTPNHGREAIFLNELPAEDMGRILIEQIEMLAHDQQIGAIGLGFPGIILNGVIEDSPNLPQMKGLNLGAKLTTLLRERGLQAPVHILNDADALAAGVAATQGNLDKQIRVWWLGSGVGLGLYPSMPGAGEGGHLVVTLDPKEHFCRCGGRGHLEGIMGTHAMRMRFLDLEPDEVFAEASAGDQRCLEFVKLWHRALAAATATSIHLTGPGKFYISGPNAKYIQLNILNLYLHEMVKMSPLQGSSIDIIPTSDEIAVIGAAVSAAQQAQSAT